MGIFHGELDGLREKQAALVVVGQRQSGALRLGGRPDTLNFGGAAIPAES